LKKLCVEFDLQLPDKTEYLKTIKSVDPECMSHIKKLYYAGCNGSSKYTDNPYHINIYNRFKEDSKKSIQDFIESNTLDIKALTKSLSQNQKDKHYCMMSKNYDISYCKITNDYYQINTCIKDTKYQRYICLLENSKKLKVLFRWKNGNGIAYPALQISM
jgi:hypothetical protein